MSTNEIHKVNYQSFQSGSSSLVSERYKHLLSLIFPVSTLLFLLAGLFPNKAPHDIVSALAWGIPFCLVLLVDWQSSAYKTGTVSRESQKFYDGILYVLICLQLVNILCMLAYISQLRWNLHTDIAVNLVDLIVIRFLVGTSSGTSGIVVAHELIHRPQKSWQLLGRLLLCTVCYDHFVITHKRGHHQSLGLPDDIATAKLGENFKDYWRRVYPGYLRYAWKSEQERLASESKLDYLIHNQVLQGLLVEFTALMLIVHYFGWLAAFMFLYQACVAVRILEAVNYFQHWGLENGQFGSSYGWVSRSWISRFILIGLSHHIGHHQDENRQFHEIAFSDRGPLLPYGYFVMNLWVKLHNKSYQEMAIRALENFRCSQFKS